MQIFLADLDAAPTPTATQLTFSPRPKTWPSLDDSLVVWAEKDATDYEIWLYDIASGVFEQVTNNDYDDLFPEVSGWHIAWEAWKEGYGSQTQQLAAVEIYHGVWGGPSRSGEPWVLTPEPATCALLVLGALGLIARRCPRAR